MMDETSTSLQSPVVPLKGTFAQLQTHAQFNQMHAFECTPYTAEYTVQC